VDEVQALVALNGVAITAILTLAVIADGSVGLAITGIVVVAIAGSAALVVLAKVQQAKQAGQSDGAVSRATFSMPQPQPTPSSVWLGQQHHAADDAAGRRVPNWLDVQSKALGIPRSSGMSGYVAESDGLGGQRLVSR
jgi:hypothetical protein